MSPRLTIESGKKYDNHLHYTLTLYLIRTRTMSQ
jgi:hypothetical protein